VISHVIYPAGDLLYLNRCWYVTHPGLLRLARRNRCAGSMSNPFECSPNRPSDDGPSKQQSTDLARAKALSASVMRIFHVSPLVHWRRDGHLPRPEQSTGPCASYGIAFARSRTPFMLHQRGRLESRKVPPQPANGNYGGPRVRDHPCQIIRQNQLDPPVKAMPRLLRHQDSARSNQGAGREFVTHLADWAEKTAMPALPAQ